MPRRLPKPLAVDDCEALVEAPAPGGTQQERTLRGVRKAQARLATYYLLVAPINGIYPTVWLAFLPVALLLHTGFALGLGSLTARMAVPIRDVKNFIPHLARMWFYLSPILWPLSLLEDKELWIRVLMKSNPMYAFLSLYRTALLGRPFELDMLLASIGWAVAALAIGITSFVRSEGAMGRYL